MMVIVKYFETLARNDQGKLLKLVEQFFGFSLFKELFFLGLGVILFGIVGALSMASIENVPEDLVDNAAVFGALCLVTALVFIADLLMSTPKKDKHSMVEHVTDRRGVYRN